MRMRSTSRAISSPALNRRKQTPLASASPGSRSYEAGELYGIVPQDTRYPYEVREIIARIVDGSEFHGIQAALRQDPGLRLRASARLSRSASSPTTASCSPSRRSRARISSSCATSAGVPLVFLQNITGFMVGKKYENAGIAKDGAKMVNAVACRHRAQVHRDHRRLFRRRQLRHVRPRLWCAHALWMWPNARISVMGGEQAASVLATVRQDGLDARGETWPETERGRVRAARSGNSTRPRDIPTTPPPGSGTTA